MVNFIHRISLVAFDGPVIIVFTYTIKSCHVHEKQFDESVMRFKPIREGNVKMRGPHLIKVQVFIN